MILIHSLSYVAFYFDGYICFTHLLDESKIAAVVFLADAVVWFLCRDNSAGFLQYLLQRLSPFSSDFCFSKTIEQYYVILHIQIFTQLFKVKCKKN